MNHFVAVLVGQVAVLLQGAAVYAVDKWRMVGIHCNVRLQRDEPAIPNLRIAQTVEILKNFVVPSTETNTFAESAEVHLHMCKEN